MADDSRTKRKTIVFCCNSLWGLVNFRGSAIEALARDGHRVVLISPCDLPPERAARLGAEVVEWQIAPRSSSPLREAIAVFSLWRIYRRVKPDLAFHFTIKPVVYGAVIARLTGVRCVSVVTGLGYLFLAGQWRLRFAKLLYRLTLRHSREVWFLNAEDRDFFVSQGLMAGVASRTLPGEGVDLQRFSRVALPDSSREFVFLMIARLVRDKGVVEYGEAARLVKASHPRATFRLMGPRYDANAMSIPPSMLAEWQENGWVEYLGAGDDVRPAISACHCVVLPSYREGMPRVLMEAAAMGRGAIATDVPGCRDVVIDGSTGVLCEPANADSLGRALVRLLSKPREDLERMASAAFESAVARFDDRAIIGIYREVVAVIDAPLSRP